MHTTCTPRPPAGRTGSGSGPGSGPGSRALRVTAALVLAVTLGAPAVASTSLGGPAAASGDVATTYRAPLAGPARVLRPFDPPPRPWLAGHRGVDLAAPVGAIILAPAAGVVTFAGDVAGRGVVTVLHPDGRRSSLEPVTPAVLPGARVAAGASLGSLALGAHGGSPAGPALHWGVRVGDEYVDPWGLLPGSGPVVLLPVG